MKKFTISDAAEYFGVSKEAIHNRIRRGTIQSSIENGVKMVIIDESSNKKGEYKKASTLTLNDDRYYKLLEEQNENLQKKVEKFESEIKELRDQKEQMLIDEREKLERIYKDKDEQLKNILQTLSSKFMLDVPQSQQENIQEEVYDAEIEDAETKEKKRKKERKITLKKYFKQNKIKKRDRKKLEKKFSKTDKIRLKDIKKFRRSL